VNKSEYQNIKKKSSKNKNWWAKNFWPVQISLLK